jgi:hypothetical protein
MNHSSRRGRHWRTSVATTNEIPSPLNSSLHHTSTGGSEIHHNTRNVDRSIVISASILQAIQKALAHRDDGTT